jgi:probable F420-dependent oxidoreductase
MATDNPFGSLGVWLRRSMPLDDLVAISRGAEELGYGTVWISGGGEPGVLDLASAVLDATTSVKVATGIVNVWVETPESVTAAWHRLEAAHPGRLYVGLGISHQRLVEGSIGQRYAKPLATTAAFLDGLDAQRDPLPPDRRLIAALGPKMCRLAAERSLGTHPYLVTTGNTAAAREGVGADAVVAPELGVILDPDLVAARAQGREALSYYLGLPNYTNNWLRSGFTEDDLADGGSDRLLDDVLALGDTEAVSARVAAHRAAGADHVCLQALGTSVDPLTTFRRLAGA